MLGEVEEGYRKVTFISSKEFDPFTRTLTALCSLKVQVDDADVAKIIQETTIQSTYSRECLRWMSYFVKTEIFSIIIDR